MELDKFCCSEQSKYSEIIQVDQVAPSNHAHHRLNSEIEVIITEIIELYSILHILIVILIISRGK